MNNIQKFLLIIFFIFNTLNCAILKHRPQPRKAFLRFNRSEAWDRHIDRERFREELVRKMQEMTRLHNTRLAMQRVQSQAFLALQKRFANARTKLDRMRDHTEQGINDLIAIA